MAYAPQTLRSLAGQWESAIGSAVCSGIVGDSNHNYGYHRSAGEIPASDYSRQLPGDVNGIDPGAACALDMSHNQAEMKLITGRFYASWRDSNDLRLNHTREVIGTLNGSDVIYMDTQSGQQGTSDSSHLWHIHVGGLRSNLLSQHAVDAILSIVVGESWDTYRAKHPDDPYVRGAAPSPTPPPPPRPAPPVFPLPGGHVFGDIADPRETVHGGYYGWERPHVQRIQQRLIDLGYAPNRPGWADGRYEQPTMNAVRAFQVDHHLENDAMVGPITWSRLFA